MQEKMQRNITEKLIILTRQINMETLIWAFIIKHKAAIAIITVIVLWLTFALECYCDRRDGIEGIDTDTIDMGD